MGRATRADVARRAGVSPSTVSVVLNGKGDVVKIAQATQERVRRAARELDYIPSAAARALRMSHSRVIALLLGDLPDNPYVPVVHLQIVTAMREVQKRGYFILPIAAKEGSVDPARQLLSEVTLAGVVCETTSLLTELGDQIMSLDIPLMWLSITETERYASGCGHVRVREHPGIYELIEELAVPDAPEIVEVWGPTPTHQRLAPAMAWAGTRHRVDLPAWSSDAACDALGELFATGVRPDIVWCADDLLTSGALRACEAAGLAVPDEIQVVGWGDQSTEGAEEGAVTSAHWPIREAAALAVNGLIDRIERVPGARERLDVEIDTSVVWRATTRRRTKL